MVLATSYTEAIHSTAFHWPALDHMVILVAKDPGCKGPWGKKSNSFWACGRKLQGKIEFAMADWLA